MTIEYTVGDATQPRGLGPRVICHVVNDIGRWGAGFVLSLRRWPQVEREYREWHRTGSSLFVLGSKHFVALCPFALGNVQFVPVEPDLWVANIIAQHRTINEGERIPIRYDALEMGLRTVGDFCEERRASVHAPRLGSGLARGDWSRIATLIETEFVARGVSITIYDLPRQVGDLPKGR